MRNILIDCAMEKEGKQIVERLGLKEVEENIYRKENITLVISGLGKQMTMMNLAKYLEKADEVFYDEIKKPDLIINIGYAGSTDLELGKWYCVSKSYNYEWYFPGEEKYSMEKGNQELELVSDMVSYPCYSAESFVESTDIKETVLFDMELHSIALLADVYKIPLISLKKVSDNLNYNEYYDSLAKDELFELVSGIDILEKNKLLK